MACGSTLARTLLLTKREIRASLSAGAADDQLLYQAIEMAQEELAATYDWRELSDQCRRPRARGGQLFPPRALGFDHWH